MSDMNFICPTCKRPTHPTDNEIIEHLAKEKDRYLDALGERTKELIRTRKALEIAINAIESAKDHNAVNCVARGKELSTDDVHITLYKALEQIIALEQKE